MPVHTVSSSLGERFEKNKKSLLFARYADALLSEGKTDEAVQVCLKGVVDFPEYVTGYLVLGRCLAQSGDADGAIKQYEKALTLDKKCLGAMKALGDLLVEKETRGPAAEKYGAILQVDPLNETIRELYESNTGGGSVEPVVEETSAEPGAGSEDVSDAQAGEVLTADPELETPPAGEEAEGDVEDLGSDIDALAELHQGSGEETDETLEPETAMDTSSATESGQGAGPALAGAEPGMEESGVEEAGTDFQRESMGGIEAGEQADEPLEPVDDDLPLEIGQPEGTAPEMMDSLSEETGPASDAPPEIDGPVGDEADTSAADGLEEEITPVDLGGTDQEPEEPKGILESADTMDADLEKIDSMMEESEPETETSEDVSHQPDVTMDLTAEETPEFPVSGNDVEFAFDTMTADAQDGKPEPEMETAGDGPDISGSGEMSVDGDMEISAPEIDGAESGDEESVELPLSEEEKEASGIGMTQLMEVVDTGAPSEPVIEEPEVFAPPDMVTETGIEEEIVPPEAVEEIPAGAGDIRESPKPPEEEVDDIALLSAKELSQASGESGISLEDEDATIVLSEEELAQVKGVGRRTEAQVPEDVEAPAEPEQEHSAIPDEQPAKMEAAHAAPVPEASKAAPGSDAGSDEDSGPPNIATVTLAEIYFKQGLREQALEIYRQLLEREPKNRHIAKRIKEIERAQAQGEDPPQAGNVRDRRKYPRAGVKIKKRKK